MKSRPSRILIAGLALFSAVAQVAQAQNETPAPEVLKPSVTKLKLPGKAVQMEVGGAGRFLVLHVPTERQLVVVDLKLRVLKGTIPAEDEEKIVYAAGLTDVIVVANAKKTISRYDLLSLELKLSRSLEYPFGFVALGSDCARQMLVQPWRREELRKGILEIWDARTLTRRQERIDRLPHPSLEADEVLARASPGGQSFSLTRPQIGTVIYKREGIDHYKLTVKEDVLPLSGNQMAPLFDQGGGMAYYGNRVYAAVSGEPTPRNPDNVRRLLIPSDNQFVKLSLVPPHNEDRLKKGHDVNIHTNVWMKPIAVVPDVDIGDGLRDVDARQLTLEKRIAFSPGARCLASLRPPFDVVELRTVDIFPILRKEKAAGAFPLSQPERFLVRPGEMFLHELELNCDPSRCKFEMDSPGMTISKSGLIQWKVAPQSPDEIHVIGYLITPPEGPPMMFRFELVVEQSAGGAKPLPGSKPVGVGDLTKTSGASKPAAGAQSQRPRQAVEVKSAGPKSRKITPTEIAGDMVKLKLSGMATSMQVGGAGRFVILHIPSTQEIAIVDLCEGSVRTLPANDDDVAFAAGLEKLVVARNIAKKIHRYDLFTLEEEKQVDLNVNIADMAMGSASEGPILVVGSEAVDWKKELVMMFDADTLKKLPGDIPQSRMGIDRRLLRLSVAARGGTFCVEPRTTPFVFVAERPGFVTKIPERRLESVNNVFDMRISPDGQSLYTAFGNFGLQPPRTETLNREVYPRTLPINHEGYVLQYEPGEDPDLNGGISNQKITVVPVGSTEPLIALTGVEFGVVGPAYGIKRVRALDRIVVTPAAKVMAVLQPTFDEIELRRLDLEQALSSYPHDYLFVNSSPPGKSVKAGERFQYQMDAKSNKGGLKYKLVSGPRGMTVSQAGLVEWTVAAGNGRQPVVVGISNVEKKEIKHQFDVVVDAKGASGAASAAKGVTEPTPAAGKSGAPSSRPASAGTADNPPAKSPPAADKLAETRTGKTRTFTDANTGKKLEAKVLGLAEGKLRVQLSSGMEYKVPLERLSREDRLWLQGVDE
jgi:hypothetical protein